MAKEAVVFSEVLTLRSMSGCSPVRSVILVLTETPPNSKTMPLSLHMEGFEAAGVSGK